MRRHPTLTVLLAALALGACGTRGALTLPPPASKTAPASPTSTAPPAPPTSTPADLNTVKDPAQ